MTNERPGRDKVIALLEPPSSAPLPQLQCWARIATPAYGYEGDPAVFAAVARRILSPEFDGKPAAWVGWLAGRVCSTKTRAWLPGDVRAEFLEAAATVESEQCAKAVRALTRRRRPGRTGAAVKEALEVLRDTGG